MMAIVDFNPATTTMENIKASGEFDLIKDVELRKQLIDTYASYSTTATFDQSITHYTNDYVTPYLFANVRFSDFSSLNSNFLEDPAFENIVIGYLTLLNQQITGYNNSLTEVKTLLEYLPYNDENK